MFSKVTFLSKVVVQFTVFDHSSFNGCIHALRTAIKILFYETGNECDFHFQHIDRKFTALYFNSQGCQKSLK